MRKAGNVLIVLSGILGGSAGYWIGHAAGWSESARRSIDIGGFPGAILTQPVIHYLLSVGIAVLFVCVAALLVTWLPAWRAQGVLQHGPQCRPPWYGSRRPGNEGSFQAVGASNANWPANSRCIRRAVRRTGRERSNSSPSPRCFPCNRG